MFLREAFTKLSAIMFRKINVLIHKGFWAESWRKVEFIFIVKTQHHVGAVYLMFASHLLLSESWENVCIQHFALSPCNEMISTSVAENPCVA